MPDLLQQSWQFSFGTHGIARKVEIRAQCKWLPRSLHAKDSLREWRPDGYGPGRIPEIFPAKVLSVGKLLAPLNAQHGTGLGKRRGKRLLGL